MAAINVTLPKWFILLANSIKTKYKWQGGEINRWSEVYHQKSSGAPSGNFILTEGSDPIITENNQNLITET